MTSESKHFKFLRTLPCIGLGKNPCSFDIQVAHLRKGTDGGMSKKPSHFYTVPLCGECHRYQHNVGEPMFWKDTDLAKEFCLMLYKHSGRQDTCISIIFNYKVRFYNL